jgi:hypothetical protein
MACTTEEECRREKIIKDNAVAAMAKRGVAAVKAGKLTLDQLQRLIALDEAYLAETVAVAPELAEG